MHSFFFSSALLFSPVNIEGCLLAVTGATCGLYILAMNVEVEFVRCTYSMLVELTKFSEVV